jgi:hypothetical protein
VFAHRVERDDGLLGDRYESDHRFAPLLMRRTHDRDVGYPRQVSKHSFNLGLIHVFTSTDDHVLKPVDDEQTAILVEVADVAGVKPSRIVEGGGSCFPIPPVPRGDIGPPDHDLTR